MSESNIEMPHPEQPRNSHIGIACFSLSVGLGLFLLMMALFLEMLLSYVFPLSCYVIFVVGIVVFQIPFLFYKVSIQKIVIVAVFWCIVAALIAGTWTSQKSFLIDLHKVKPGMTAPQVEAIMGKYIHGTGWPALPGTKAGDVSTLTEIGSNETVQTSVSSLGELAIENAVVYRHSEEAAYNSDWGVVTFKDGKVVSTDFMPD
jgi:hypothetical protein